MGKQPGNSGCARSRSTATRTEHDIGDVPATVSVSTEQQMERRLVQDIRDLTRYEPGVSVRNDPVRFGASL